MKLVAGIEKYLYCSKSRPYHSLDMTRLKLFIQPRCGRTLKHCRKGKIPDHNNIWLPSEQQSEEKQLSLLLSKQTHIPFWLFKPTRCWFSLAATRHYSYYLIELRYCKKSLSKGKLAPFLFNIYCPSSESKESLTFISFLTAEHNRSSRSLRYMAQHWRKKCKECLILLL